MDTASELLPTERAADSPDPHVAAGHPIAARGVLVAAVLGTALAYMSDDMLNLAAPSVARDLDATMTGVQWILNSYYVALVSFVLVAGAIGDVVGHRRVFVSGLMSFSAGGVLCAVAPDVPVLVAARAVQGVGAAMVLAAGLALVTSLTPPDERNRTVGLFFGMVAGIPALGPFISGTLVDVLSWRWLFVVPLVLPLAALVVVARVPETVPSAERHPDVRGAAAAFVSLAGLSVALIAGPASPWLVTVTAAIVAVAAVTVFLRVERRHPDPMLPLALARRPLFLGGNLVWLLGCLTSAGAIFFLAVALQVTLGLRPFLAGLLLTPVYLVMMVGSPMAGRLAERTAPVRLILTGLAVYTGGLWWLSHLGPASTLVPDVVVPLVVMAVGMAAFTAPLTTMTMGALDDSDQGVASGVNNAMGQLAGLLAFAVLPLVAGLANVGFDGPEFAAGYTHALRAAALLSAAALPIALIVFRAQREPLR